MGFIMNDFDNGLCSREETRAQAVEFLTDIATLTRELLDDANEQSKRVKELERENESLKAELEKAGAATPEAITRVWEEEFCGCSAEEFMAGVLEWKERMEELEEKVDRALSEVRDARSSLDDAEYELDY